MVIILTIYLINFFFGLRLLLYKRINSSLYYHLVLLTLLIPVLTPLFYILNVLDDYTQRKLIKKRKIDLENLPTLSNSKTTSRNDLQFFTNGKKFFDDMFMELNEAKNYIHISFFALNTDEIGKEFFNQLTKCLQRGVQVIILYDQLGSIKIKKKYLNEFRKHGGKLVPFLKIFTGINYRNHRKVMVIDNKIAYLTGFNIGDKYLGKNQKLGIWVDSALKITGNAVEIIEKRFLADLMYALKRKVEVDKYLIKQKFLGSKIVEVISSGVDISDIDLIENKVLEELYQANERVYLQTPYLILNDRFLNALLYLKHKGIDIKVMIPSKNDHPLVYQATLAYASILVSNDIEVYLFSNQAFLHSKVVIIDNHALISTHNLDIRSFIYSLEIGTLVIDKDFTDYLTKVFLKQVTYCKQLTKEMVQTYPVWTKLKLAICKLFSHYL